MTRQVSFLGKVEQCMAFDDVPSLHATFIHALDKFLEWLFGEIPFCCRILKTLKYCNIFSTTWNGLNMLTPSLSETGNQNVSHFLPIAKKDLVNFSSLYILNTPITNIPNLKHITESKLLNYSVNANKELNINKLILDQNMKTNQNLAFCNKISIKNKDLNNYFYLPTSMFYENEETFIHANGFGFPGRGGCGRSS